MRQGTSFSLVLILLALGGAPAVAEDGTVIIGMGFIKPKLSRFDLYYKPPNERDAWLWSDPAMTLDGRDMDFVERDEGDETGKVVIKNIKPGEYVFYNFQLMQPLEHLRMGIESGCYQECDKGAPQKTFAVPFTVKPGEATYVGDFSSFAEFDGYGRVQSIYLVLSDQHERDLAIAKKKFPNLGPVTIAVPDPAHLASPFIRARE